jgi:FkbM family methyltransferase
MNLERLARRLFRAIGVDVKRASLPGSSTGLTLNLLRDSHAGTVLDVGANEGQFAQELIAFHAKTKIVSFEPVAVAHTSLVENSRGRSDWIVAPKMALSDKPGQTKIYVTKNCQCSSLRPAADDILKADSAFDLVGTEQVQLARLDGVYSNFVDKQSRIYLKIDVQGHEKEVIAGASGMWNQIVAMQIEISFSEIYSGQPTGFWFVDDAVRMGLSIYGISNGWREPKTGKLLQADVFFIR